MSYDHFLFLITEIYYLLPISPPLLYYHPKLDYLKCTQIYKCFQKIYAAFYSAVKSLNLCHQFWRTLSLYFCKVNLSTYKNHEIIFYVLSTTLQYTVNSMFSAFWLNKCSAYELSCSNSQIQCPIYYYKNFTSLLPTLINSMLYRPLSVF